MIVFKLLVKFVKVLNSETAAASLAAAAVIGMILGLIPILSLLPMVAIVVLLFFRVNIAAALLGMAVFKLASLALGGFFHAVGAGLLEKESLFGFWTWMTNAPLLSLMDTNHSVTLGATLTALVLALPVFLGSRWLVGQYRDKFNEWFSQLGVVTALRGSKLYRLYQWIDSPFGT